MRDQTPEVVERLVLANDQVFQLLRTVEDLVHLLPEIHHASWHYLVADVECMQRRLEGALDAISNVFQQDPATYVRPQRRWE